MIEREGGLTGRSLPPRDVPKDMDIILMSRWSRCNAVVVYRGSSDGGQMGPMIRFVEGPKTFRGTRSFEKLLTITQWRLHELSEGHLVRASGTKLRQCKLLGGGIYE